MQDRVARVERRQRRCTRWAGGPALSPGPKFTAGTPTWSKRATSVHACFGSTPARRARSSRCTSGWSRVGPARRRQIGDLDLGPPADQRAHVRLRLLERRVGREAVVEVELEAVGHDVAAAAAAAPASTLITSRNRQPVERHLARRARAELGQRSAPALWIAFSPCHGRALWAVRPSKRHRRVDRAQQPSCSSLSRRLEADREVDAASAARSLLEHRAELVLGVRPLLALVEDQRQVARGSSRESSCSASSIITASPDFMSAAPAP